VPQPAPKTSLEDTLQAFIQASSQTNKKLKNATMANSRDIQELKNFVANIEGQIGQLANQVGEREEERS
jgi:hypothetical protein